MEGARRQRDLLGLVNHSLEDLRVDVALVAGRVPAEEVEVLFALDVPHENTFATVNSDGERPVVAAHFRIVQVDERLVLSCGRREQHSRRWHGLGKGLLECGLSSVESVEKHFVA